MSALGRYILAAGLFIATALLVLGAVFSKGDASAVCAFIAFGFVLSASRFVTLAMKAERSGADAANK